jgi:hypothetical protein
LNRTLLFAAPLLVTALSAAALLAPATSGAAAAACVPGKTTVGGKSAVRYCGTAKASAKVGAKTFRFVGGTCATSGPYFTINIGTLVTNSVAGAKPGPTTYFGVTVTPPSKGVHLKQALGWTSGGKRYSVLSNQITVKAGLKSGSFTGVAIGGAKVSGSFSC